MNLYNDLQAVHSQIIKHKPIILNLTNYVTMDFMADTLLALGAAPIMSENIEEIKELVNIAHTININIGTLNSEFHKRSLFAAQTAQQQDKCVVLDPVGAGASKSRTHLAIELAQYSNIIRGNSSEIIALGDTKSTTAGVEAIHPTTAGEQTARILATKLNNTIVISGKTDLVISANNKFANSFGIELMTKITGMGCVLTAVIATFAAIEKDYAKASLLALTFYTLCAENVHKTTKTPAKFRTEFIDNIYDPNWSFIEEKLITGN